MHSLQAPRSLAQAGVQPCLIARWRGCNAAAVQQQREGTAASSVPEGKGRLASVEQLEQCAFRGPLRSYKDVQVLLRAFPTRSWPGFCAPAFCATGP